MQIRMRLMMRKGAQRKASLNNLPREKREEDEDYKDEDKDYEGNAG
jgi:hypothetical protein